MKILLYVGLVLVAAALVLAWLEHAWIKRATITEGVVDALVPTKGRKGKTSYRPQVRFVASDGTAQTFVGGMSSSPPAFKVGQAVFVAFDPSNYQARILTFGHRFGMSAILCSVGCGIVMLSLLYQWGRTVVPQNYLP